MSQSTGQTVPASEPLVAPQNVPVEARCRKAYEKAVIIFDGEPDWVTYYREVLGVQGVVRQMFPSKAELAAFEKSEEYHKIQQQIAKLRQKSRSPTDGGEPTRVITVRLPKSLHESLRDEAYDKHTSINQLCISKLLQIIEKELVPPAAD